MKRNAILIKKSDDGKRAIYVDEENAKKILTWVKESIANTKKFHYILDLLVANMATRDLYDKENFETGCEHITAIKPFKGKKNPRIYCQQFTDKKTKVFVIVAAELLPKKKSEKLTNKEKTIIRRVAKHQYTLRNE